tara:strand:+ start:1037 stop:2173 length:1137 start_codon:yes stop_codon:yes gene_type:complete
MATKNTIIRKLAENIEASMLESRCSPKDLAQKADISYSSLMPILNGSRECGTSKFLAIAQALNVTPNALLKGLYSDKSTDSKTKPRYLATFISTATITYAQLYDIETDTVFNGIFEFVIRCMESSNVIIDNLVSAIQALAIKADSTINPTDVAIYLSVQQYERVINREKIHARCNHTFNCAYIQADATTNHHAFVGQKNGICISINDGDAVTYSLDKGKTIKKLHGYGFPISDVAGNYWLGCEAIKYVISVQENIESETTLSDKLLVQFNHSIDNLYQSLIVDSDTSNYLKASNTVKELASTSDKAQHIIKKSTNLLIDCIKVIDKTSQNVLPIYLAGELADLYEPFFPSERIIKHKTRHSSRALAYGLSYLKNVLDL